MTGFIVESIRKALGGTVGYLIAGSIALAFAIIGLAFLWQGLEAWLAPHIGATAALFAVGGLALVIAGLVILIAYLVLKPRRTPKPESIEALEQQALELGLMTVETLREQVRANPGKAALIALAAGTVLGANPRLARAFIDVTRIIGR